MVCWWVSRSACGRSVCPTWMNTCSISTPSRGVGCISSLFSDGGHCPGRRPASDGLMKTLGTVFGPVGRCRSCSRTDWMFLFTCCNRSIMSDIQRDSRVVSLSSRAGVRSSLVTILDQLQRCQKSLNEFLEVRGRGHIILTPNKECFHHYLYCPCATGEALCFPQILFHRRWWSVRDSRTGHQPNGHPVTPQETICRSDTLSLFCFFLLLEQIICMCVSPCTGIHRVVFDEQNQHIVAMCSLEGETVPLRNLIRISSLVEVKQEPGELCQCGGSNPDWTQADVLYWLSACACLIAPGVAKWAVFGNEGDFEGTALWMCLSREKGGRGPFTLSLPGTHTFYIVCNICMKYFVHLTLGVKP